MKNEYDNVDKCPICGGNNEVDCSEYTDYWLSHVYTKCTQCGHEDEWAFGWYRFGTLEAPGC